ncbi:hypothetical protein D3C71_1399690 [compost metagenome]
MRAAIGHQFLHVGHRQLGIGDQHVGHAGDQRDRRQVLFRLVLHLALEDQGIDGGLASGSQQQGGAVRRGAHDRLRAQHAAGARLVLHHHALGHFAAQPFGQQPAHAVDPAASGKRHDQGDGAARGRIGGMERGGGG